MVLRNWLRCSVSHYEEPSPPVFTYIYKNYTLKTTVSGGALGWIDNSRLLVAHFSTDGAGPGGPGNRLGAVTGGDVVFPSTSRVLAIPY